VADLLRGNLHLCSSVVSSIYGFNLERRGILDNTLFEVYSSDIPR
jgi:hypothetical protein